MALAFNRKRSPALSAPAICLGTALFAPLLGAEDLRDTVVRALNASPEVAEAANLHRARGEELEQARAGYRPSLDLLAGYGYEYTDSPGSRASGKDSVELGRGEFGLQARQPLFDGWATRNDVERQESRMASALANLDAVAEAVAARAAASYIDLLRFDRLKQLSGQSLEVHLRIQDQVRLRSDAGVGRKADLEQVNARVALAEANLVAAQVNVVDAQTAYRRAVGDMPPQTLERPLPASDTLPSTLEEAVDLARTANPKVHVATADIAAAEARNRFARRANYPTLDLEVSANMNNDIDGISGYNNDLEAMLRLRYNLYRGGADAARIRETAYNVNEAREVRNLTYRQLEEEVRLAWAAYEATARQVPLLAAQERAAEATREAYEKQFNIGQRTLIDLLNSENEVLQARQSLVNAESDRLLAYYRLLQAMGATLDHFGLEPVAVPDD
jgi:adhesin transport system outer membrane protein